MSDTFLPLDVVMRDGRTFTLEPFLLRTKDDPTPAVRIWCDGVILQAVTDDTMESTMDKAFGVVKAMRKG